MAHAPGERVRAVLLGELLHGDSLEVPLVVGEACDPVVQRVPYCLREGGESAEDVCEESAALPMVSSDVGLPCRRAVSIQKVRDMVIEKMRCGGSGQGHRVGGGGGGGAPGARSRQEAGH
eukprot:COSAG04_NODE_912_length_9469_cov_2.657631_1_plen_120_part_00